MKLKTRLKFVGAAVMALALAACGSDSESGSGGSGTVSPTSLAAFAGLWEGKTASRPFSVTAPLQSGDFYFLFTNVRQSDMILTLYSKNRTANCLDRTVPVPLRATGGNQYLDSAGEPLTLVLNDVAGDENDRLTVSFPSSVTNIVTTFGRAIGVSAQDLQVCGRIRIDRRANAGLDSIGPALADALKR